MMKRSLFLGLVASCIALPTAAQACIEGTGRQFLFVAPAGDVPEPLVAIEGVVVRTMEDEAVIKLAKAIKGIPAGTEVTIRRGSDHCGHQWGADKGMVYAVGGFQSFRLPNPVFEAVPLRSKRPPRADIRKYIVDPDYVRKLEGGSANDRP